jgi:hypothetical protein
MTTRARRVAARRRRRQRAKNNKRKRRREKPKERRKPYDEAVVKLANVILKGKRIAESWSPRKDQGDGIKELRKRLVADAERFGNSIFDILSDTAMIRLAPILIALSQREEERYEEQDVSAVDNAQQVQRAAEGRPGHEAHLQAPGLSGHLDSLREFVWP